MGGFGILGFLAIFFMASPSSFAITLSNKVTNAQVNDICSHSANINFCVQTLMHDGRTSQADMNGVAGISLDISSASFNQALRLLGKLVRGAGAAGPVRQRYQTCIGEYTNAIRALNDARTALRSRNFRGFYDQSITALSHVQDCKDEFQVPPVERSGLPGLNEKNAWLASIGVAVSGYLH